jgi:exopolysaccharide biosynthesis WecB/TagA/CpsF family protein
MTLVQHDDAYPKGLVPGERVIGCVAISPMRWADAHTVIAAAIASGRHVKVAFANAHVVNVAAEQPEFARALDGFLVLPDGVGVDLASLLLHGAAFPDNLNGTDFTPSLLQSLGAGRRVRLIGAKPGVAQRAAASLARLAPQHDVQALHHGFFPEEDEAGLLSLLESERPDILLVAMGNPRQELWIAHRIDSRHCSAALGVGALFDFLAGDVSRAPRAVRVMRLEWVFRLAQEPRRLWRRYLFGNASFVRRIVRQKLDQG